MKRLSALLLSCAITAPGLSAVPAQDRAAQAAKPRPREQFQNAEVLYDWVTNRSGQRLRTFTTRPRLTSGKVPVIFFVGWLSCDSMEYPDSATRDGFGILLRRLIEESGFATVRMDKPGVGESEGVCEQADFQAEIEGWQAAFGSLSKYDFADADRVFVIGLSNGGGFSPLAAGKHAVRGFVSAGSWGRTWYEHMLELERRRLTGQKKSPEEIDAAQKIYSQFYDLYLNGGMTPGQILASHPDWKPLWGDSPSGQYGRPAAFYQQLQRLNLGEVWQRVDAPVLVIRGSADEMMSRADSETIAETVNRMHAGRARYVEIDGMSHGFTRSGKFCDEVVPLIFRWIREHSGEKRQAAADSGRFLTPARIGVR